MKKNKLFTVFTIAILSLMISCNKNDATHSNLSFSKIIDLTLRENLTNELGIYTGQFKSHNGNINFRTTTMGNNLKHSGRITAWYLDDITPGNKFLSDGGDYIINEDIHFKFNGERYYSEQLNPDGGYSAHEYIVREVLGQDIRIKNQMNNEKLFDEKFYVPLDVSLTGKIEESIDGSSVFRKMDRNNFTFGINYDEKNENGILIKLIYSGEFHGMSMDHLANQNTEGNFKRVIHLQKELPEDITLPIEFFRGIPKNGIVTMYIGRGNGKYIYVDGKEHYVRAFTERQLRIIVD